MTAARGRTELLLEKLRADIAPEDKQQVERDLAALRRRVVWITVTTDHVGTVLTDVRLPDRGLAIQNLYPMPMAAELRLGLRTGSHVLAHGRGDGQKPITWVVELKPGRTPPTHEDRHRRPRRQDGDRERDVGVHEAAWRPELWHTTGSQRRMGGAAWGRARARLPQR